jgi:hypothetical protein
MPSKINPKQLAKYFDSGIMPIESHHKVSTLFVDVEEERFLIASRYIHRNLSFVWRDSQEHLPIIILFLIDYFSYFEMRFIGAPIEPADCCFIV